LGGAEQEEESIARVTATMPTTARPMRCQFSSRRAEPPAAVVSGQHERDERRSPSAF
jgi:hypothetical protein